VPAKVPRCVPYRLPIVTEASSAAMGDPTYSRNELLMETAWAGTIGHAIAS